jgi:hypothetical protein
MLGVDFGCIETLKQVSTCRRIAQNRGFQILISGRKQERGEWIGKTHGIVFWLLQACCWTHDTK